MIRSIVNKRVTLLIIWMDRKMVLLDWDPLYFLR